MNVARVRAGFCPGRRSHQILSITRDEVKIKQITKTDAQSERDREKQREMNWLWQQQTKQRNNRKKQKSESKQINFSALR